MLPRSPLAKKCVDLINEYDRGLEVPEQQVGAIEGHIMVVGWLVGMITVQYRAIGIWTI